MAVYDKDGNVIIAPIEKGVSKKKKKSDAPSKVVKRDAPAKDLTEVKDEVEKSKEVKERNNRNRNFGKAVERSVAKLTDGDRVIASGAIKTSIWNLVGDVQVRFDDNNDVIALIECKGSSGITPKGDKTFSLKKSVLDQAMKEADLLQAVGVVWIHWLNASYEQDDYVVLHSRHFMKLLDHARKAGADIR